MDNKEIIKGKSCNCGCGGCAKAPILNEQLVARTGLSGMRQDIYQCWWGASPSPLAMWRTNSDCRYRYGRETAGSKRVLLSCSLALRVRLVDSFSDRQVADSETD